MKKLFAILLFTLTLLMLAACGSTDDIGGNEQTQSSGNEQNQNGGNEQTQSNNDDIAPQDSATIYTGVSDAERENMTLEEKMETKIEATITMENGGVITLELYPDLAPQSVRNFVSLAKAGYYDGLKFHRIISGFMIQGGCPDGTGMGNPGYCIRGEFNDNGFTNELRHTRGVLSMARSQNYDSAGSQFFIMHGDSNYLDGKYAAFGQVTSGMDVVDEIARTPVIDDNGTVLPDNMPAIQSITIDSNIDLPEPEKLG